MVILKKTDSSEHQRECYFFTKKTKTNFLDCLQKFLRLRANLQGILNFELQGLKADYGLNMETGNPAWHVSRIKKGSQINSVSP